MRWETITLTKGKKMPVHIFTCFAVVPWQTSSIIEPN